MPGIPCSMRAAILLLSCAALAGAADFDVRRHGAKGDGTTADTAAIQGAIDAATAAGGGTVVAPAGKYAVGRIVLKSNITLRLEKDAMLLGSSRKQDYDGGPNTLVYAADAEHVAIEGEGAINGQATADFGARWGAPATLAFRVGLVRFEKCRDVSVRGVSLLYSDSWTLHLRRCEKVRIDGLTIKANYKRLNSDGIDPNSCKDVKISRCNIVCGDDAIVLKSTEALPCEDIEVSDCVLESATAGLKIGTESKGDFRNIRFRNCKIVNSPVGVGLYIKDGAVVDGVIAENVDMDLCPPTYHAVVPLFIDIEKRHADSKVGVVRNVVFRGIRITGGASILLQGMPESLLENITLADIIFNVREPQDYAKRSKPVGGNRTTKDARDTQYIRMPTWAAVANVKGLTVDGLSVTIGAEAFRQYPRSALSLFNVEGAKIVNVSRSPGAATPPAIEQADCKAVSIEPAR